MRLSKIKLNNFRLFENLNLEFSKNLVVITGLNATGKSTILEGVNYLGLTKSFRDVGDDDLLLIGKTEFSIIGWVESHDCSKKLRVCKNEFGKSVFKNETRIKKISDYLGELLVVSFSNFDLIRLAGSSRDRRKIFEPIICQISNDYVIECNYYKKILNERNALLKRLIFEKKDASFQLLEIVDKQLVERAKRIIQIRKKFVDFLNEKMNEIHKKICGCYEDVCVRYLPSIDEDQIENELHKNIDNDIRKGSTSCGPHRDDFGFYLNNKNVATQGSQGQQRNVLITIKLAFVEMIKKQKEEEPILLLDDVFSELDKVRQNNLLEVVNNGIQTIISSATLSELDENLIKNALVITLKKEENENG